MTLYMAVLPPIPSASEPMVMAANARFFARLRQPKRRSRKNRSIEVSMTTFCWTLRSKNRCQPFLKHQTQSYLHLPRVSHHRCNRADSAVPDGCVRLPELRVIQDVER